MEENKKDVLKVRGELAGFVFFVAHVVNLNNLLHLPMAASR